MGYNIEWSARLPKEWVNAVNEWVAYPLANVVVTTLRIIKPGFEDRHKDIEAEDRIETIPARIIETVGE